jgi:hypothetical protein
MESLADLAYLAFGLGFFLFVIRMIHSDSRETYERRVMEAREFGFGGKNQHNAKTLHEKK